MPWARRGFRGGKIFARVDDAGAIVVRDGLADIKYRAEDLRIYNARASAVTPLPGEGATLHPELPGEAAVPRKEERTAASSSGGEPSGEAAGEGDGSPAVAIARARPPRARTSSAGDHTKLNLRGRPGAVVIYTDGACTGNPGPAGIGVVLLYGGHRKEISEYLGHGTNNIAELTAVLRGLQAVKDPTLPVDVFLDSSYSIGVLSKNWKPKVNGELIATIRREMQRFKDLCFIKVPGHAGVPENERADELAGAAVERRG